MTKFATEHADALAEVAENGVAVTFARGSSTVTGYAMRVQGKPTRFDGTSLVITHEPVLMFVPDDYGARVRPGDEVEWEGEQHSVAWDDPFAPDGTVVFQRVGLRR
jgi:hypothetical protein